MYAFTNKFWSKIVKILKVVPKSLDILMNNVWSDWTNFDKAIVLYEYGVASQVAMCDWRIARLM